MKQRIIFTLVFLVFQMLAFSQTKKWKTETTKDKITVKSCISDTLINKESRKLVEYVMTATVNADYNKCIEVLKDVSLHKNIFDYTVKSEKVKELSDNEYLIYYFIDMPWPIPNSDSVVKMKFTSDKEKKQTYFQMIASPTSMKDKGVKRLQVSTSTYLLKKISDTKTSIVATTYSVATLDAPDWLTNTWIPEGPAEIIRRISKISKEK